MKLDISVFKGMFPKVSSRLLPPENAEFAQDCLLENGDLAPGRGKVVVTAPLRSGTIRSIYKYGNFWFNWTTDVHAIRNPLAKDPYDRIYFTGAGTQLPQVTSNLVATGSPPYPAASYALGIPAPNEPIVVSGVADGTNDANIATDESRVYVYTYVSAYGEEGPPSLPSNTAELLNPVGAVVSLSIPNPVSNIYNLARKRIYRSATSASDTAYYFVGEVLLAVSQFNDSAQTGYLGAELSTETYERPPQAMKGITLGANGIIAGYDKNEFVVCEPYLPYAWPLEYRRALEYNITAIAPTSTGFIVGTEAMPYLVSGVHPRAMSDRKIPIAQACIGPNSMVDMGKYVLYASPDGLVMVSESGQAELATKNILTRQDWQANYFPSTIKGFRYEGQYLGFYNNGFGGDGFLFDPESSAITRLTDYATAGFHDLLNDVLYLVIGGQLYQWDQSTGGTRPYTWRSKVFQVPDVSLGALKVRTATPELVGLTVWADGGVVLTLDGMPREAIKIAPARGTRWQIELRGTAVVEHVTLAQSMDELG